jgi:predicted RNase H-like nuclease
MDVLGVDACGKQGWVGIRLTDGAYAGSLVDVSLEALVERAGAVGTVAVDMPLGLLESGWRAADLEARKLLGARCSTVFMVAPAPAWTEKDHPAASERCRELTGNGLSRQAWALAPKLLQARRLWQRDPGRTHEVHPELCFRELAGGTPPPWGKKTWRGQNVRRRLLAAAGIEVPDAPGEADAVPADDVLDAAAAAWSAHRIALGTAGRVPAAVQEDALGRAVEIRF